MKDYVIWYKPVRQPRQKAIKQATTAKAAREGFEWANPTATVLLVYPHWPDQPAHQGICRTCAFLTHSHEDGAAYCTEKHGWLTQAIYTCDDHHEGQPV